MRTRKNHHLHFLVKSIIISRFPKGLSDSYLTASLKIFLCLTQDMPTWGYKLDKHLDEFVNFVRIDKNSRILDVTAGTGMVGQKVKISTAVLIS